MDNLSGQVHKLSIEKEACSEAVMLRAYGVIREFLKEKGGFDSHSWDKELIQALNRLLQAHPQNLTLIHLINFVFLKIEDAGSQAIGSSALLLDLEKYDSEYEESIRSLGGNFSYFVNDSAPSILLHSQSLTIRKLIKELCDKGHAPLIYQTISHPNGEGKNQAKLLSDLGLNVNYIDESAIGCYMKDISIVLSSADAIVNKRIISKAGTLPIALCAKHFQKNFYVVADSKKILTDDGHQSRLINYIGDEKKKDASAFWDFPPKGVSPVNYFFDATPTSLVTRFITDKGLFGEHDLDTAFRPGRISRLLDI